MSARKSLLKRFDELISLGKSLLSSYENTLEFGARKQKWQTGCLHILERTFGEEGIYFKDLSKALSKFISQKAHLTHGVALIEGAKEEIEKGFLYKLEHLISTDFFDSITEQAEYLLKSGFKDVAAILGRVVIENTLKDLGEREGITVPEKIKLAALNQLLCKEGVYVKNVWRTIQAQIDIGNDAAHGDFDKYDAKSVKNMLTWIREMLLNL